MTTSDRGMRVWSAIAPTVVAVLFAFAATVGAETTLFTWTQIPAPVGSANFTIADLSNDGQACGNYTDTSGHGQGYRYLGGTTQTLFKNLPTSPIVVRGIRDGGVIVGEAGTVASHPSSRPALWDPATGYAELPRYDPPDPLYVNYVEAQYFAINNAGQIACRAVVNGHQSYIHDAANGTFAPVGTWGALDYPTTDVIDINESGVFVGNVFEAGVGTRGLIGQAAPGATAVQWLETFWAGDPGRTTRLSAVNDAGASVGHAYFDPDNPSWRWAILRRANGQVVNLGSGGSTRGWAADINDHGQIVGSYNIGAINAACLYSPTKGYSDLQPLVDALPSGYTLTDAVAINDHGQIAVNAVDGSGHRLALILNPIIPTALPGGGFDGGLDDWQIIGSKGGGQAWHVTDPADAGNYVVQLATGSPIAIRQMLNTPDVAFDVNFRYYLPVAAGNLTVDIDEAVIGTIDASAQPIGVWLDGSMHVSDPAVLGMLGAEITFTFDDAAPNTIIYLDNIAFAPVPEPMSMLVLSLAAIALPRRRQLDRRR